VLDGLVLTYTTVVLGQCNAFLLACPHLRFPQALLGPDSAYMYYNGIAPAYACAVAAYQMPERDHCVFVLQRIKRQFLMQYKGMKSSSLLVSSLLLGTDAQTFPDGSGQRNGTRWTLYHSLNPGLLLTGFIRRSMMSTSEDMAETSSSRCVVDDVQLSDVLCTFSLLDTPMLCHH
jgi:hypothetical protein